MAKILSQQIGSLLDFLFSNGSRSWVNLCKLFDYPTPPTPDCCEKFLDIKYIKLAFLSVNHPETY